MAGQFPSRRQTAHNAAEPGQGILNAKQVCSSAECNQPPQPGLRKDVSRKASIKRLRARTPTTFRQPATASNRVIAMANVTFQCLLPCSAIIGLWARPSLLNQKGQVVYPIVLTYPARIDNMGQIVFGVRDNKIGVCN